MRQVSIIPRAGLCNRMRAMASGIWVAKQLKAEAVIYWHATKGCNCTFTDIFKPVEVPDIQIISNGGVFKPDSHAL